MEKKTFVTLEQLREITKDYPTPFHLYDERDPRERGPVEGSVFLEQRF